MKPSFVTFDCEKHYPNTRRDKPFRTVLCTYSYNSDETDKSLIDGLINKGTILAQKVNPNAANDAQNRRMYERIFSNCVAGLIAEDLWKRYINRDDEIVFETEFSKAQTQIDLKVKSNEKKIEVRSSFPYAGIAFALCHDEKEFDVIGSYSNLYKAREIQKDFYVRTLFHLEKYPNGSRKKFIDKIQQDGFEAYLTGGATWEMMSDDNISKNKTFIPEDEISQERLEHQSEYRVVPFSKALDTVEVRELIVESSKNT